MTRRAEFRNEIGTRGAELRRLATRSREVLLLAAIGGGRDRVRRCTVRHRRHQVGRPGRSTPLWVAALLPLVGLSVAAASLRWIGPSASSATADEYLHAFHDPEHELRLRPLIARMIAGIATLGSGAPMGLEGPSLYLGSSLGDIMQRRLPRG